MDTPPRKIFQTLDKTASYPYSRKEYVRRVMWNLVQATLFRYSPPRAFAWRRWLLRAFGGKIGEHSGMRSSVRIFHPWLFEMGDWSMLAHGVVVYNLGPVRIGHHSVVSQDAYLCAGTHDYTKPDLPLIRPAITIGDGVWVAAQAFVGPGVSVGDNCVIAARAVVVKDVPPGVVAGGNPCRVIKARPMDDVNPATENTEDTEEKRKEY
jgi:putative colanic acid biosynthesis acetyltransferase WcaF